MGSIMMCFLRLNFGFSSLLFSSLSDPSILRRVQEDRPRHFDWIFHYGIYWIFREIDFHSY